MRHLRNRKRVFFTLCANLMNAITAETNKSITSHQLAERWQCNIATIRRRQFEGLLKGFKIGNRYRFRLSDVVHAEQLMAANPARQRFDGMDVDRREKVLKGLAAAMVSRQQKAATKQKATSLKAKAATVSRL
jgi:hypothetical protein